jgi:hypothetical protein
VVGNQTGSSTPGPSFDHNLCFRCSNEQCKPILDIYASKAFQWYKKRHKTLRFDPCNRSLKFRESTGTPSPTVGVALGVWVFTPSHSLTLSYTPGSMWCDSSRSSWPAPLQCLCLDSWASSWFTPLQALCFGREPKARVATFHVLNMDCLRKFANSIINMMFLHGTKPCNIENITFRKYQCCRPYITIQLANCCSHSSSSLKS